MPNKTIRATYDPQTHIAVSKHALDMLVISAVRYALGRMTYIVGDTAEFVTAYAPRLSKNALTIIVRDITEHEPHGYGMDMDKRRWMGLLDFLKMHLEGLDAD